MLADCLPLKCYFFIFFQKTSFFVVFWVWINRLSGGLFHQTRNVFCTLFLYNSFAQQLVDESDNETEFISKTSRYFDLACNMQRDTSCYLRLRRHQQFNYRLCLNWLGNVNNMLIQNRINDIDISEMIDLGRQLRHFLGNFGGYAAT